MNRIISKLELHKEEYQYRWFLLLVLFRPAMDSLYGLKHVSILASPLYWIGVLTPILIVVSVLSSGRRIVGEAWFNIFALMTIANGIAVLLQSGLSFEAFEVVFKVTSIVFLFYYLKTFLYSRKRFDKFMRAVGYSSLFVYAMVLYEVLFGSIGPVKTTGGVERIQGLFADNVSYGLYLNMAMITWLYLYYGALRLNIKWIVFVIVVTVVGILSISHVASLAVLASIGVLYIMTIHEGKKVYALVVVGVIGITVYSLAADLYTEQYDPKISRELEVLYGERSGEQAFHGRMTRWNYFLSRWSEFGATTKALGVPFESDYIVSYARWLLIAPHNDFIRIMFASGIIGLLAYVIWLLKLTKTAFRTAKRSKFVLLSTLVMVALYSITTLPSLYPNIVYFLAAVSGYHLRLESETT
jgi:O-antigen ligase